MIINIKDLGNSKYHVSDFIFFWGHQPLRNDDISESCFSQWWKVNFYEDGILFNSAEQYMMYQKSILFKDYEIAHQILKCDNPKHIKKHARNVRDFDETVWLENRIKIVSQGNLLKFSQNEKLRNYLLNTANKIIVEASPTDKVLGIGMKKDSLGITKTNNWKGLNLLGFILMDIRDRIR